MLELNALLASEGIDTKTAIVARHRPFEPALNRVFPWIVAERPDLFRVYQQIQYERLEAALVRARTLVSFIAHGPRRALFAGAYEVRGARPISYDEYWSMPENRELEAHGMTGLDPQRPAPLLFDLVESPALAAWKGKLVIGWSLERSWWRWANRNVLPVEAITEENGLVRDMPAWNEIVLAWSELSVLPARWRAALAQWRGVYFIFDVARHRGYVGSAYGADNILGRWLGYAATGHGGNVELRRSNPADLNFSILERTSPDMDAADVIRLESRWKDRLHTRQFGLNEN